MNCLNKNKGNYSRTKNFIETVLRSIDESDIYSNTNRRHISVKMKSTQVK